MVLTHFFLAPNDHRYEAGSASAGTISSNYSSNLKAINIGKVRELTHDSIRPAKKIIIGSEAWSEAIFKIRYLPKV